MTCSCLFRHFIVARIEWNIHLQWGWALLRSTMLMRVTGGLRRAFFISFLSPGAFLDSFIPSTCTVILLSIMARMTKKKNVIFHLSKVISRLTALRQRTQHPRETCIHSHHVCIASVFWCALIINNVLNSFRGDTGCQCSPSDAAPAVDPGKSCFSAALSLWFKDAPCPSLAQTVCIFLTVFSSSLLWRGFSIPGQWVDYHKCVMLQAMYIHNMHLWKVLLILFCFFFCYVSVQYTQQHLTLSPFYYFSTPTYSCFPDSSALVMAENRDSFSSSITHQYWWDWAHADHQYLILNSVGLLMELWGGGGGGAPRPK